MESYERAEVTPEGGVKISDTRIITYESKAIMWRLEWG